MLSIVQFLYVKKEIDVLFLLKIDLFFVKKQAKERSKKKE
jgi:hypothetical protein